MLKNYFKRVICAFLILCMAFSLLSCVTPSGKMYTSKDKNQKPEKIVQLLNDAKAKTDAIEDIEYSYSFFVESKINGGRYRLGTENTISLTGRGTPEAKGHRVNTYTSIKEGSQQQSKTENFYYSDGKIYTKRFGKNYWSQMPQEEFITYTAYSELSVNTEFLNEAYFNKAVIYNRFKGITEIVFTEPSEYLHTGIISFIGLDKTDYKYEIKDVVLTAIIAKNGTLSEKHLTFIVDYHSEDDEKNIITYEGDFAYTVNKTSNISVAERNKGDNYKNIPHIALLSSLSEDGYLILSSQNGFDISYKKYIKIKDSEEKVYSYNGDMRIVSFLSGDKRYYSSIDTERTSTDELIHDTAGIFINENGYTEKIYDYTKDEITSSRENQSHDYKNEELLETIMEAVAAERLFENEIVSVSVKSEDENNVTYTVGLDPAAKKYFAGYLINMFADSSDQTIDVSEFGFTLNKCDIEITVRKSDGCIMYQLIDYAAVIRGYDSTAGNINVEGRFEMTVNATGDDLTLLTPNDWSNTVEINKNAQ